MNRPLVVRKGGHAKWNKVIGEQNDGFSLWFYRIFLPNIFKMLQGIVILITSFIIIIQSSNIVDLLKESTALFVISSVDNGIYMVADNGYLGAELSFKASEVKTVDLEETKKEKQINHLLRIAFTLMVLGMLGGWLYIRINQSRGIYMSQKYPKCEKAGLNAHMGDGYCWGLLNYVECGFDDGDCLEFNKNHPDCHVEVPYWIGDGRCHGFGDYFTDECGWDGGDCL